MLTTIILDAALRYAGIGLSVVPIRPGEKAPYTEHGVRDATTSITQIKRWWQRWPKADIALACGAASGFDVLDVDRQHGGICLLYTSPSPRDKRQSRMPSSA